MGTTNVVRGIEYVGDARYDPNRFDMLYGCYNEAIVSGHIIDSGVSYHREGGYWFICDSSLDDARYRADEPVTAELAQRYWNTYFPQLGDTFVDCRGVSERMTNTEHSATPAQEQFVLIVWNVPSEGTDKVYLFESERGAYKLKQFLEENDRLSSIYPVRVWKD